MRPARTEFYHLFANYRKSTPPCRPAKSPRHVTQVVGRRPVACRKSPAAQTPRARSASRAGDTHPAGRSAGFHRFLWEDGDHLPGTSFICTAILATSWSRTLRAALAPAVGLKACRFGAVPGPCAGWISQPRGAPGGLDNPARRRLAPAGSLLRPLRSSLGPLSPVALSLPWRSSARADVREAPWRHSPRLRIVCLAAGGTGEAG